MDARLPVSATLSLPPRLKELVAPKTDWRFGEDGSGKDPLPVDRWEVPKSSTPAEKALARKALGEIVLECRTEDKGAVIAFVEMIGGLSTKDSKRLTVADAKAKIKLYVPGLRGYPPSCFTVENTYRVGREIDWFPSYGELCKQLDKIAEPIRTTAWRLKKITEAPDPAAVETPNRRYSDLTEEEKRRHDALMASIGCGPLTPPRERGDGGLRRPFADTTLRDGPGKMPAESAG